MAGGMDLGSGAKGGKKPLDTAINLVPFIDLMAVTISFLIMTAVWNQVGRLTVSQGGSGPSDAPAPQEATVPVQLVLAEKGLTLQAGARASPVAWAHGAPVLCHATGVDLIDAACEDASLVAQLRRLKAELPTQRALTLKVEDLVRYEDLVRVLDACNLTDANGKPGLFPEVAVATAG